MISKRKLLNRISVLEFNIQQINLEFALISKDNFLNFNQQKQLLQQVLKCPSRYYVGKQDCKYGTVVDVEPTYTNNYLSYKITFDKDGVITVITEKTKLKL